MPTFCQVVTGVEFGMPTCPKHCFWCSGQAIPTYL
jgi:hypothetical protein